MVFNENCQAHRQVPNCSTNVIIGKNAFFVRIGCCILGKSQPRVKDYTLGWNFQQFFYIDIC